jgi:hypothetical protein
MALETMLEKLQLKDEKNILIQGLPSSIEKQFAKVSFAKSVTPLLRSRGIDFALVFAVNKNQLGQILSDVIPALAPDAKCWIAYPKVTSKIASDLNRDSNWECLQAHGLDSVAQIALDNVWTACRFRKTELIKRKPAPENIVEIRPTGRTVSVPEELKVVFQKHKPAEVFFDSLSFTNKKEYVEWIVGAKKVETKTRRLESLVEKLTSGKKNPTDK